MPIARRVLTVLWLAAVACSNNPGSVGFGGVEAAGGVGNGGTGGTSEPLPVLRDVTFVWSFDDGDDGGASCRRLGVTQIDVTLEGHTIFFPCQTGGLQQGTVAGVGLGLEPFRVIAFADGGSSLAEVDGAIAATADAGVALVDFSIDAG